MTGYSFNIPGDFIKAKGSEINASYKQLSMVCNAIRYMKASKALDVLDGVISMQMPILFPRYSKYMGARHELGGKKGSYPIKASKEVRAVLVNAMSNAESKGRAMPEDMVIIHASANKVQTISRTPSQGSLAWGRGMYGRSAIMHSDIELCKVEIVLGEGNEGQLTKNMKYFIKKKAEQKVVQVKQQKAPQTKEAKKESKKEEKKAKATEKKPEKAAEKKTEKKEEKKEEAQTDKSEERKVKEAKEAKIAEKAQSEM